jgi:hypothetical protein
MLFYFTEKELDDLIQKAHALNAYTGAHLTRIQRELTTFRKLDIGPQAKRNCWERIEAQARELQDHVSAAEHFQKNNPAE